MNHCKNCNVDIIEEKSNCVLCGKSLDKTTENTNMYYPKYQPVIDKKEPIVSVLQKLALLGLLICIVVNLFETKTLSWSLYVLGGVMLCVTVILRAFLKKMSIAQVCSRLAFWLSAFLIFIELYTGTWGWGVMYTIPFIWMAICLFFVVSIFVQGFVNFEIFKPLILILIFSVTSFLLLYFLGGEVLWPTLSVLLLSMSEIILMFMFRFKRSIRSLKRDFGI